ncbi:MAG: hypothetical protein ACEY3E_04605, partial [Candidatus Tisiphia sp.]
LPNKNLEFIPKKLISSDNNSANQSSNNIGYLYDSPRSNSELNHSAPQKSKQQKNTKKRGKKKSTPPKEVELESKTADLI